MLGLLEEALFELRALFGRSERGRTGRGRGLPEWLRNNNFTFLGMREYTYSGEGENATSSGIRAAASAFCPDRMCWSCDRGRIRLRPPGNPRLPAGTRLPDRDKANVKSVVHRRAYMDYVGVKRFGPNGKVVGELRIVGLFTATAYTRSVNQIPLLRAKVEKSFRTSTSTHAAIPVACCRTRSSAIRVTICFRSRRNCWRSFASSSTTCPSGPRVRVCRGSFHFDRFVSLIVYVPREDYNSLVRERSGTISARSTRAIVSAYFRPPEGGVARVHIIIGRREGATRKSSRRS